MFIPDPRLVIPGLSAEALASFALLMEDYHKGRDEWGNLKWRYELDNNLHTHLYSGKQLNEAQYVASLVASTDEDERRRKANYQIHRRCKLVATLLHQHEMFRSRRLRASRIAVELQKLQPQLAGLPADDPLLAFCVSVASTIRGGEQFDFPDDYLRQEMAEVKELPVHHLLAAMHLFFEESKAVGELSFSWVNYDLGVIRSVGASDAQVELLAAMDDAEVVKRQFEHCKQQFNEEKSRLNRPQFAARLEEALRPAADDGRRRWTFDQVKQHQEDAEARFYASVSNVKLWHPLFVAARARLVDALAAAAAEVKVMTPYWGMAHAFDSAQEIAGYKAMVNCITARYRFYWLDDTEARYQKILPELNGRNDFNVDPLGYVNTVLQETVAPAAVA